MVINKKLLYVNESTNTNIVENSIFSEDEDNLFAYSLGRLLEGNKYIIEAVQGKTETEVLTEGFNFYGILSAIVNGFIRVIEELIGKFLAVLTKLAGMGASFNLELKGFEGAIKRFNGSFTMDDVYVYSNLYPSTNTIVNLFIDWVNEDSKWYKESLNKNNGDAANDIFYEIINNANFNIERFKKELLSNRDSTYIEDYTGDFASDCFKYFRAGESHPISITYTGSDLYTHLVAYKHSKEYQNETRKSMKEVQKACKEAKRYIEEGFSNWYGGGKWEGFDAEIDKCQRAIISRFDTHCKDTITFLSAKLQAYKESYIQDRRILMRGMQEIAKKAPVGTFSNL